MKSSTDIKFVFLFFLDNKYIYTYFFYQLKYLLNNTFIIRKILSKLYKFEKKTTN